MINLTLITSSLFLIFSFVSIYFLIGILLKISIKKITGRQVYFSFFKTILYGLLTVVYFYAIVKSPYFLNSVSITGVPIFIFFYEQKKIGYEKLNELKYGYSKNIFLLAIFSFLIYFIAKYSFHFSTKVNTGYSDQAFYHTIASSLKLTGVETINIHTGLKLVPGMIYHYWDLWFLAFHYDVLSLLNNFDLFNNLNQFEISSLVFQPSLFVILFFALIEISIKLSTKALNNTNFIIGIVILGAFLASCHYFLEFGIAHHPKQFIISAIFFMFTLEILDNNSNQFNFFYFYPIILFYYPIPGAILIATCFIFSLNWKNMIDNFQNKRFYLHLSIIAVTLSVFCCYYFIYAQTCIPQLYIQNKPSWNISSVMNRIFIYHGYHTLISPLGVFIILNLIIICLIYVKRILTSLASPQIIIYFLLFPILNILVGHFVSAIFYTLPEEFQFYNNDYFSLSLLILFDISLLFHYFRSKNILALLFLGLTGFYFLYLTFYNKTPFYNGITISYSDYYNLKKKKFQNLKYPEKPDNLNSLHINSDILFSIYNSFPKHRINLCEN